MDRKRNANNFNARDYSITNRVMGRERLLLNSLRLPMTNVPGASGEFPVSNMLFTGPTTNRHNRFGGLLPPRGYDNSSDLRLESIASAGSLEALAPSSSGDSLDSDIYYDAQSHFDVEHNGGWLANTRKWLQRYGVYVVIGAVGVCVLGYTIAWACKVEKVPPIHQC